MKNIEIDFFENICSYCVHNQEKECKDIRKSNLNTLITYKCFNYKRKKIALKEFSEYIEYTYYDEDGKNIVIVKKEITEDILRKLKYKFDEVRNKKGDLL